MIHSNRIRFLVIIGLPLIDLSLQLNASTNLRFRLRKWAAILAETETIALSRNIFFIQGSQHETF